MIDVILVCGNKPEWAYFGEEITVNTGKSNQ